MLGAYWPTNILTNIMMNANLRTISDMITKRSSLRVQGEYREFIERMMEVVLEVHPFTEKFFCRDSKNISAEINKELDSLTDNRITRIWKLIDQLRTR